MTVEDHLTSEPVDLDEATWDALADRLVAGYPNAQLTDAERAEWLDELERYPAALVEAGVRRCRRERFVMPSLAVLLRAVETERQAAVRARRDAEQATARAALAAQQGIPMPPETRRALQLVARRQLGDEQHGHDVAAQVAALAEQLVQRTRQAQHAAGHEGPLPVEPSDGGGS
jgi:hypothetical protein